jgi:hypothetical protein
MKIAPVPLKADAQSKPLPQPANQAPAVELAPKTPNTVSSSPPRSASKLPRGPRKAENDKRGQQIAVHCTHAEKERILEAARKAGRKPGRYLVHSALKTRAEISSDCQLYDEIIRKRAVSGGAHQSTPSNAA